MKYKLLTLAAVLVSSIISNAQTLDTLQTKALDGSGTEFNGTSLRPRSKGKARQEMSRNLYNRTLSFFNSSCLKKNKKKSMTSIT